MTEILVNFEAHAFVLMCLMLNLCWQRFIHVNSHLVAANIANTHTEHF